MYNNSNELTTQKQCSLTSHWNLRKCIVYMRDYQIMKILQKLWHIEGHMKLSVFTHKTKLHRGGLWCSTQNLFVTYCSTLFFSLGEKVRRTKSHGRGFCSLHIPIQAVNMKFCGVFRMTCSLL